MAIPIASDLLMEDPNTQQQDTVHDISGGDITNGDVSSSLNATSANFV